MEVTARKHTTLKLHEFMLKFRLLNVQCSKFVKLYFLSADMKLSLADLSKRGMRTVALACQ